MPEENTEQQTKEPEFQAPSAGEHLANLHGESPGHQEPAPKPEEKPEVEKAAEPAKEPEPEVKEPEADPKVEPEKPAEPEVKPNMVPVAVVQAERQKRQGVEAELRELKGDGVAATEQEEPSPQYSQQLASIKNSLMAMSEKNARSLHSDYQEKYDVFEKAVQKEALEHPDGKSSLMTMVEGSVDQAESAYQSGKTLLMAEKYGWDTINDPDKWRGVLKEEARAELAAEKKEADTKNIAKNLATRGNNPTDLSQARAAGGDESPEWHAPTAAEHLAAVHNRLR